MKAQREAENLVIIKNQDKLDTLQPDFREKVIRLLVYIYSIYGFMPRITSAKRTRAENKKVGGVPDSAHLKGLAVDIEAIDGRSRYAIVKSALENGFLRIGVGYKHVHIDDDLTKPHPTVFKDPH